MALFTNIWSRAQKNVQNSIFHVSIIWVLVAKRTGSIGYRLLIQPENVDTKKNPRRNLQSQDVTFFQALVAKYIPISNLSKWTDLFKPLMVF